MRRSRILGPKSPLLFSLAPYKLAKDYSFTIKISIFLSRYIDTNFKDKLEFKR